MHAAMTSDFRATNIYLLHLFTLIFIDQICEEYDFYLFILLTPGTGRFGLVVRFSDE